ncbi:hypothetical protein RND71_039853 [Anisodus tanguticus]|uniref:Uncharacterized protein n=1 Tax=Anisodus tanguticus TaxID=243964 RepID=A0AAE1QZX7_9SOLA|nr:hypothetical protein RND71_039853 [Anisodus tanguticus]
MIDLNIPYPMIDFGIFGPMIDLNIPYVSDDGDIHEIIVGNSQLYSPTQPYANSSQSQRHSSSMLQSPSPIHWMTNSNIVETPSISHIHRANGVGDTRRAANILRNNIDPPLLPLVIGETVAAHNRERDCYRCGKKNESTATESSKLQNDLKKMNMTMLNRVSFYLALLGLQDPIGDVVIGLKKKVIFELLKHRRIFIDTGKRLGKLIVAMNFIIIASESG